MKKASWIVLFVVGLAVLAVSFISAGLAYSEAGDWPIGPSTLAKVDATVPGTGPALRGARGTAAAFGAAYGVLWLTIVLGPYRRGETWAWWGLLGASLVLAGTILARVPLIGITAGVPTGLIPLVLTLLGLLLDLGRLRAAGR
jgi:hypothetical protein